MQQPICWPRMRSRREDGTDKPRRSTAVVNMQNIAASQAYLTAAIFMLVAGGYLLAYGIVSWNTERAYHNVTGRQREASFAMNALSVALGAAGVVLFAVLMFMWHTAIRKQQQ